MTHIDLDYTAERLAELDPDGPQSVGIPFSEANEDEQAAYRRMAWTASEHAYRYAVHTVLTPDALSAIFAVNEPMEVRRHGDQYKMWGEDLDDLHPEPEHLVVATSDADTVRAVVEALNALGQPSDVTALWDWADDEEGDPGHTEEDLGIPKNRAYYGTWVSEQD